MMLSPHRKRPGLQRRGASPSPSPPCALSEKKMWNLQDTCLPPKEGLRTQQLGWSKNFVPSDSGATLQPPRFRNIPFTTTKASHQATSFGTRNKCPMSSHQSFPHPPIIQSKEAKRDGIICKGYFFSRILHPFIGKHPVISVITQEYKSLWCLENIDPSSRGFQSTTSEWLVIWNR